MDMIPPLQQLAAEAAGGEFMCADSYILMQKIMDTRLPACELNSQGVDPSSEDVGKQT